MVREAINHKNTQQSCVYTRHDWNEDFGVFPVPDVPYVGKLRQDDPWHWGTGHLFTGGCKIFVMESSIIGFDLFGIQGYVNNVYKDTQIMMSNQNKLIPSYWIYQQKIFEHYDKHIILPLR